MVKTIVKLVIEIVIAVMLFYIIAKYTSVFDRFFANEPAQEVEKESSIKATDKKEVEDQIVHTTKYFDNEGNQITKSEYLKQFNNEADYIISAIQQQGKSYVVPAKNSCSTPWGTKIPHGSSITAYSTVTAIGNSYCDSQIRRCNNGRLEGSFINRSCEYIASNTVNHTVYHNSDHDISSTQLFRIPYVSPPETYINPVHAKDNGKEFRTNGKVATKNNGNKSTIVWNNGRLKYPYRNTNDRIENLEPEEKQANSCKTPWGDTVEHGKFVYAYKSNVDTNGQEQCLFEKRACLNGKLSGTYGFEECKSINNKNFPSVTYYPRNN